MSCNGITIIQNSQAINVFQENKPIQINQIIEVIEVCAQNPIAQFLPFFLTATMDGQTVFTLPVLPLSIWVAINGTEQSQAKTPVADFIVSERTLTLSEGIDNGDTVFGMIQVA